MAIKVLTLRLSNDNDAVLLISNTATIEWGIDTLTYIQTVYQRKKVKKRKILSSYAA